MTTDNMTAQPSANRTVTVTCNTSIGQFMKRMSPDDANRLARELEKAASVASDPRVRRDSLKRGDFYKMVDKPSKFVCMILQSTPDAPFNRAFDDGTYGNDWKMTGDTLVYRCKDFGGEIL